MATNSVINSTLIVRSQAEYSPATQTLSVRFILEMPATGQHRGFADVEALLCLQGGEIYAQMLDRPVTRSGRKPDAVDDLLQSNVTLIRKMERSVLSSRSTKQGENHYENV